MKKTLIALVFVLLVSVPFEAFSQNDPQLSTFAALTTHYLQQRESIAPIIPPILSSSLDYLENMILQNDFSFQNLDGWYFPWSDGPYPPDGELSNYDGQTLVIYEDLSTASIKIAKDGNVVATFNSEPFPNFSNLTGAAYDSAVLAELNKRSVALWVSFQSETQEETTSSSPPPENSENSSGYSMMMEESEGGNNGTLNDLDGDGVPNRDEILAGTNPEDAEDYFHLGQMTWSTNSNAILHIRWPSITNREYSVENLYGNAALLGVQNWGVLSQWIEGADSDIVYTQDMTEAAVTTGFFRVQVRETDANGNGLADWWEIENFGGLTNILATGDEDGDGLNNLEEFYYGYDPQQSERDLIHSAFKAVAVNTNNPEPDSDDGTEFFDFLGAGRPLGLASNAADSFGEINGEPYFSGGIYFNNDMENLYVGISGIKLDGANVFVMLIDTGTGGQTNLQNLSTGTPPYGFSRARNWRFPAGQFTPSVGLLLGGRYGDGQNYDNFDFVVDGTTNNTGQGVYRLSDNSDFPGFTDSGPSAISQWARDYSGDTFSAHAGIEVAISLNELNVSPGDTIKVAAFFAGGTDGSSNRYVSREVYGKSVSGSLDGGGNFGFNTTTFIGADVHLSGPKQTIPGSEYPGFNPDDAMIQVFFWNADSPDENPEEQGQGQWYVKVASNVSDMADAGFTKAYLPVPTKGESGQFSMGYDLYDHYDVGQYDQKGGFDTRFGNLSELINLTASFLASNISPVVDIVMNHMRQDSGSKTFDYPHNTFEKGTNDFHPSSDGNADELKPYHKTDEFGSTYYDVDQLVPHMRSGLKDWGHWLTTNVNYGGYRFDLTQRMEPWFIYEWMNYPIMRGKFACLEYWRLARPNEMREWLELTGYRGAIWDWYGRDLLYTMCYTNTYNFDISQLTNSFAWLCPSHAIAYCENHDTFAPAKTSEPEITRRGIIRDKGMAYAVVTFGEALPSIYWHDYYDKPYHDGVTAGTNLYQGYSGDPLKPEIDRQLWIRKNLLAGPQSYLVTNEATKADLFVAQRAGDATKSGAILAVNDHESLSISNWVSTPWINMMLRDWVPTSSYITVSTDTNGFAWIGAPSRSYRVYAPTNATSWSEQ